MLKQKQVSINCIINYIEMKICIIANGYPTPQEPQWGCFEKDQAMALKKQGHDITVLYVDGTLFKHNVGITHKVDNGINIYGISYFPDTCGVLSVSACPAPEAGLAVALNIVSTAKPSLKRDAFILLIDIQ